MTEILVACPNLSLDRTIEVASVAPGHVHRSIRSDARGGGKGVNVARALAAVGVKCEVIGFVAGHTGRAVEAMLAQEDIQLATVGCDGETRSCLIVVSGREITVFNESGPKIDLDAWDRFESSIAELLSETRIFVCSGSFPPNTPEDAAARLVRAANANGAITICDTSRVYLEHALSANPYLVTPNLSEANSVLSGRTDEPVDPGSEALDAAAAAARALVERGPDGVVVTAGSAGAALAEPDGTTRLSAARVDVRNPVGAGDCLVAGIVAGLAASESLVDAARRGMAMAAAGCETFAAGMLDSSRAEKLLSTWG